MEAMFRNDIVCLENVLNETSEPKRLSLSFLQYITDNFSEERKIAGGGFGVVYKGEFKNRTIAVKKLIFTDNLEKEFDREMLNLLSIKHENVVRLLGYCNNRIGQYQNVAYPGEPVKYESVYSEERIMCFEYISNGSLADHIHDELRGLDWNSRYKIIKEICQALHYLHNERKLVHRDLKPDNILMDNLMVPKIADLGISKLLDNGVSKAMASNAIATWEYAPPEFKDREVSVKYDIYSLGIIIIELVTGSRKDPDLKAVLTRWRHRWNKSNETIRYQQVAKCIEIGLSCQNKRAKKRPFILQIIKYLKDVDGGSGVVGQEIACWNELLWVEPPELFFPFQINKHMSCSLELHNEADSYMAFFIKTDRDLQYNIDHNKGIIQPRSHFNVSITLLAQEEAPEKMCSADEFTIKSKKVIEGLTAENITKEIFSKKSGDIVDKVSLGVVFDAQLRAPCCISEETEEHLSLVSLEISGSQETGSSRTQSVHGLDKVTNFLDKHDKKQYRNADDSTLQSGNVNAKVNDEEPTTIAPPNSGRVHVAIKSNNKAPLLRHNKRVMLELTGSDYTCDRPGLDLVAVLHVGSSLKGWKMEETKTAMRFVVRKLSPIDRLSVVTFSFAATKLCPLWQITESSRHELLELIDGINNVRADAISIKDGLQMGLKVLAERKVSYGRVAAIILMCDNRQSIGKATEVSVGDVPVHTFGFGSSSDDTVLSAVAANSMGGTFSQVQENDIYRGGLTKAFSQCLAGLLTVSVQDLELTVAAVGDESIVVETSAGSYPQTQTQHEDRCGSSVTVVRFGNLYSGEVRRVIVDLLLPAIESERSADILKVTCSYSSRSSGSWQQFVAPPETLTMWRTGVDLEEEEKPVELQREEAHLQTVKMVKDTRALFATFHGHLAYEKLKEAQSMLVEQSDPLLRTELQQLFEVTDTENRCIWRGRPYALSFLSSHDRQRYAARGDIDKMRLFATPRMDMYLEQAIKFCAFSHDN